MTQRVFNAECDKDKTDFFKLMNESVMSVMIEKGLITLCYKDGSKSSISADCFVLKINWGDLTEIKRPEKSESIGKEPDFIPENLTVMAHGNKFTMWNYKQDANFESLNFNSVSNIIDNGDVVFLNLANDYNTMAFFIKDKNEKITLREK